MDSQPTPSPLVPLMWAGFPITMQFILFERDLMSKWDLLLIPQTGRELSGVGAATRYAYAGRINLEWSGLQPIFHHFVFTKETKWNSATQISRSRLICFGFYTHDQFSHFVCSSSYRKKTCVKRNKNPHGSDKVKACGRREKPVQIKIYTPIFRDFKCSWVSAGWQMMKQRLHL